ncbi:MAG: hypothetical protein VB133_07490 [Anaeromusa sp.]|uniref:hypothetical protein n=1 Tax=Anaeromusa sp. TaxID=1872520 RepID=UPI002B1F0613|nr:hypothetical protein [Anaeromusa sp.]MEA4834959.1 hypothetical protein [Anaeromusa sp.]
MAQAMGGLGDALQKVAAVQDKMQEDKVANDVVAAQTEYQKRLSDALYSGDNALLARKGEGAATLDKDYLDTERKIRQEVTANLPAFDLAHTAFNRTADREQQSGLDLVNRYKMQEGERTFKLTLNNAMTTTAETTARNYNNPTAIQQGLAANGTYAQAYAARFGKAEADALLRNSNQQLLESAMQAAYGKDDYGAMQNLLDTHGDTMGESNASRWQHALTERTKANTRAQTVLDFQKDQSLYTNGMFDPEKALAKAQSMTRSITSGGGGKQFTWDQVKELVSGNESGGNYEAHNGDSGAHGKYQFMPDTWSGVMGDAPMTPQNQELAFDKKYKQIYDQYGAAGVLVAVYAGDDNAGRYMRGEKLLGEGGEYSADAPQYSGGNEYPSVRQYVVNALGNDGRGAGGAAETKDVPMFDATELAALKNQFQGVQNDQIREKNRREQETRKNALNWLAVNDSLPTSTKLEYLNGAGLAPAEVKAMSDNLLKKDDDLAKKRQEANSVEIEGALGVLKAKGLLTVQDVNGYAGSLSRKDYWKWLETANGEDRTEQDNADNLADKDWHGRVLNDPLYGTTADKNTLIGGIQARLDVERVHGTDRADTAKKWLAEATDKEKLKWLGGYAKSNEAGFSELDALYPGMSALVKAGNNSAGGRVRIDGYEWRDIINSWADRTAVDPYAKQAWDYLVDNRLPINENVILRVRNRFAQEAGAEQVDSLY